MAWRGAEAPPAPLTFGRNTWRGTEIPESDRSLRLRSAQNFFFFFKAISVASPGRLQSFEIRRKENIEPTTAVYQCSSGESASIKPLLVSGCMGGGGLRGGGGAGVDEGTFPKVRNEAEKCVWRGNW